MRFEQGQFWFSVLRRERERERVPDDMKNGYWLYNTPLQKPLNKPVAADPLGKLYNKDAVLEYLIDKSAYGDGDQICGYLKGVKVSHSPSWLDYKASWVVK